MAASTNTGDGSVPGGSSPTVAGSGPDGGYYQYSVILEHLIGDKRQIKDLNPSIIGGLPNPHKTDEQKMIERGMESCAFKAVLACVGGTYQASVSLPHV